MKVIWIMQGPEIQVHLSIALLFSLRTVIGYAGPATALESTGAKWSICYNVSDMALMYRQ